jgi:hypothetical protein
MRDNKWARLLAYVTGLVNQRLLSVARTESAVRSDVT